MKSSTAKDQRLSTLNPAQISGTCGRLMCCLRHEHEFYVQQRKRFPKEGKIIATALGEEKVVQNDIFRDLVTLRTAEGEQRTIPLAQLRKETAPGVLPAEEDAAAAGPLTTLQRADRGDRGGARASSSVAPGTEQTLDVERLSRSADDAEDEDAPDADEAAETDADGEEAAAASREPGDETGERSAGPDGQRRRRRRRGRRGGRRSRPGPDTPPSNTD